MSRMLVSAALAAAVVCWSAPARAVIPANLQVRKIFAGAAVVVAGKVEKADPAAQTFVIAVDAKPKGKPAAEAFGFKLKDFKDKDAEAFFAAAAAGSPAVMMIINDADTGEPSYAYVHAGDTWMKAAPVAGAKVWRAGREFVLRGSFPGRSADLVRMVEGLAKGEDRLLNEEFDHAAPGVKTPTLTDLGTLGVKPAFVTAVPKTGLLVGTADGVRLFTPDGKGYKDATAESPDLSGLKPRTAAAPAKVPIVLIDGEAFAMGPKAVREGIRLDLPAGTALASICMSEYPGHGKSVFAATSAGELMTFLPKGVEKVWPVKAKAKFPLPADAVPGGVQVGDWTGSGAGSVFVLTPSRIALYELQDGKPEAVDVTRFTGIAQPRKDRKILAAAAADFDVDGRPDLYVVMDDGQDLVVLNRGFGCFFPHTGTSALVKRSEWKVGDAAMPVPAFVAGTDLDGDGKTDVLFVSADGRLTAWRNPFVRAKGE